MGDEFDLDAFIAAEGEEEPFRFRFAGESYVLPPRLDVRALGALAAGKIFDGLRLMLGDEQWDRLQAAQATFDDRALKALFERYAAHTGTTMGEPSASTSSSPATATR